MNSIEKINRINQQELQQNVSDTASWHADYSDTPYIYIGFLPPEIQELDMVKIFSQYGIPTHINLIRDRDTGKSRGFGYLKYEDHRLCVLAVDNFNGIKIMDKRIKVDHVYYQLRDGQHEDDFLVDYSVAESAALEANREKESDKRTNKLLAYKTKDKELVDDERSEKDENDEFRDPMVDFSAADPQGKYEMIPELSHKRERKHSKKRDSHKRRKDGHERKRHKENGLKNEEGSEKK